MSYEAVVIGGGFYGCCVALLLRDYFNNVVIVEKEDNLLKRASAINQARVHNGYHYPRNLVTAYRSFINFPRFVLDFRHSIIDDFTKVYGVAKRGSKVSAKQFFQIYKNLNIPIKESSKDIQALFNPDYIDGVFTVKEFAFDCLKLRDILRERLDKAEVKILFNTRVSRVKKSDTAKISVELEDKEPMQAQYVFNCTYSGVNNLLSSSGFEMLPFKHELTEMALIEMPDKLKNIGITIMDGPFFSTMPYPSQNLHSLSHVRYTPHFQWNDCVNWADPYKRLENTELKSNYLCMIKDAERYFPIIKQAVYKKSIYEIKTVLIQNEIDDGRPILFKQDYGMKNFSVIMGGKLDNIYDVLEIIGNAKNSLGFKQVNPLKFWKEH